MATNIEEFEKSIKNNECSLLGLLIRNPETFTKVGDVLKPEMFYFKQNQILFKAIADVNYGSKKLDPSLLLSYLFENKLEDSVKFSPTDDLPEYINTLITSAGYVSEIETYNKKILDQYKTSTFLNLIKKYRETIKNEPFDISELLSSMQLDLININVSDVNSGYVKVKNQIEEYMNKIKNRNVENNSLKFGYPELDKLILGANPGDMLILAARPSVGKTAFALNIAKNVVQKSFSSKDNKSISGKTVLFFSLEMSASQLTQRILSMQTKIPASKFKTGDLEAADWQYIRHGLNIMNDWELYFNDKASLSISDIMTLCKRFNSAKHIDLVIIDYLQLINDSNKSKTENRQLEVGKISRSLKQLARELECPILVLSQLNRNVEKREGKLPVLSDLRESGNIEQDADVVMFLHRKDYYDSSKFEKTNSTSLEEKSEDTFSESLNDISASKTTLIVAKNRQGATGVVPFNFISTFNSFEEAAPILHKKKGGE